MNNITLSTGERITRSTFDFRIRKAKKQKIDKMIEEFGFIFCEDCEQNNCKPVDCSHEIPVSECLKSGKPELAYDINNIIMRGRECHRKKDGLHLQFKN